VQTQNLTLDFDFKFMVFLEIAKIFGWAALCFIVAIIWTPLLTNILYKYRLGKQIRQDPNAPIYTSLHKHKEGTPTMGGILVWGTVVGLALVIWLLASIWPGSIFSFFNLIDRGQTFLPIGALVGAALVGLADDLFGIFRIGPKGGGLRMRHRLIIYTIIALIGAWWFFFKLEWDVIHIPFVGNFNIGIWYIPIFIFILVAAAFSTNETDGLDGLAGGILLIAFLSFTVIAFIQDKTALASFCAAIVGALLAFLWFNIPPARFFMGDTGAMGLGISLGVVAMLTNSVLILPFIAFILMAESLSVIVQISSKKLFGRKVFLSTPIHHHFEAKNWSEAKVTMRFWVIAVVMAVIGLVIVFLDKQISF